MKFLIMTVLILLGGCKLLKKEKKSQRPSFEVKSIDEDGLSGEQGVDRFISHLPRLNFLVAQKLDFNFFRETSQGVSTQSFHINDKALFGNIRVKEEISSHAHSIFTGKKLTSKDHESLNSTFSNYEHEIFNPSLIERQKLLGERSVLDHQRGEVSFKLKGIVENGKDLSLIKTLKVSLMINSHNSQERISTLELQKLPISKGEFLLEGTFKNFKGIYFERIKRRTDFLTLKVEDFEFEREGVKLSKKVILSNLKQRFSRLIVHTEQGTQDQYVLAGSNFQSVINSLGHASEWNHKNQIIKLGNMIQDLDYPISEKELELEDYIKSLILTNSYSTEKMDAGKIYYIIQSNLYHLRKNKREIKVDKLVNNVKNSINIKNLLPGDKVFLRVAGFKKYPTVSSNLDISVESAVYVDRLECEHHDRDRLFSITDNTKACRKYTDYVKGWCGIKRRVRGASVESELRFNLKNYTSFISFSDTGSEEKIMTHAEVLSPNSKHLFFEFNITPKNISSLRKIMMKVREAEMHPTLTYGLVGYTSCDHRKKGYGFKFLNYNPGPFHINEREEYRMETLFVVYRK